MSLHAYIPAGGEGTRLMPHTATEQKPMLLMGSATVRLIDFALRATGSCESRFVATNSDPRKAEPTEIHVAYASDALVLRDKKALGGAAIISYMELFESLEGDIAIVPADHVHEGLSLKALHEHHVAMGRDVTLLTTNPKPYGDYVSIGGGKVEGLATNSEPNTRSITGIYIITLDHLVGWMKAQLDAGWDEEPLSMSRDVIFPAIREGRAAALDMPPGGYWDDAGTIRRYFLNNMRFSLWSSVVSPASTVHPDAEIKYSVVVGSPELGSDFRADRCIVSGNGSNVNISEVYPK